MATTVARLQAVLSANTRDFDQAMCKSESTMGKVGKVAGVAGIAIASGIAIGLKKSVDAAKEAQKSDLRLNQAFKAVHASARARARAQEAVNKTSRTAALDDEDLQDVLGRIARSTGSVAKGTKAMALAADIARGRNVSLEQASKAVEKAYLGNDRALVRLGVSVPKMDKNLAALKAREYDLEGQIKKSTGAHQAALKAELERTKKLEQGARAADKAATANAALDKATKVYAGSAKAYGESAAGAQERFQVALENLEESIGKKLLPVLTKLFLALSRGIEWLEANWPQISKVVNQGWQEIRPVLLAFADLTVSIVQTIRRHWSTIGPIVMNVVRIIRDALRQVTAIIRFWAAVFQGDWSEAWRQFKAIWKNALDLFLDYLKLLVSIWKPLLKAAGRAIVEGIKAGLEGAVDLLKRAVVGLFHKVVGWVKDALGISSPSTIFYGIGRSMIQGMINGVGSMGGLLKRTVAALARSAYHRVTGVFRGAQGSGAPELRGLVPQVQHALQYARTHGWHGIVTSGFRTYAEQARLYDRYLHGGPLAAAPGSSSHESGEAVDVTDYGTFGRIMAHAPAFERLYNYLGARDPVHFSVSGYDRGGWLPPGLSLAWNGTGRPEPVGASSVTINIPNYLGSRQELIGWLQNAAIVFQRRTGRSAFGAG